LGAREHGFSLSQLLAAGLVGGLGGATSFLVMRAAMKACFVAGVPVLTRGGTKAIEELLDYQTYGDACDWVLSRDEHDANGELVWRRVLRRFVRQSLVLNLHVRGQRIGTTAEHPFFVLGAGWTPAHSLRIGDVLLSHDGQHIAVDGVADSGRNLWRLIAVITKMAVSNRGAAWQFNRRNERSRLAEVRLTASSDSVLSLRCCCHQRDVSRDQAVARLVRRRAMVFRCLSRCR
jgi:hypothetical protein